MEPLNIVIIAPSGPLDPEKSMKGIELFVSDLARWIPEARIQLFQAGCPELDMPPWPNIAGYPVHDPTAGKIPGYLHCHDRFQAELFQTLIQDSSIHLIWAVRGGYGTSRWLPLVEWSDIEKRKKDSSLPLFAGFSDCTFIHSILAAKLSMPTIHAPMVQTYLETGDKSRRDFIDLVIQGIPPKLSSQTPLEPGTAEGIAIGGNLTCLCHAIGTEAEPVWHDTILFIEDLNEPLYKLDRMFTHLKNRGVFQAIRGLACGRFILSAECRREGNDMGTAGEQIERRPAEEELRELIMERIAGYGFPCAINFPFGHGAGPNCPILMGTTYRFQAGSKEAVIKPQQ